MNHSKPKYLFNCLDEVRRRLGGRDVIAVFLDLDGTLASITPTPKMTILKPEMRAALRTLVEQERYRVAIVSGRAMQDLKEVVKIPEITYVGNHGLEIDGPGLEFVHSEAIERAGLMTEICGKLKSRLRFVKGVIVEYKRLSLSVHYRLAAPPEVGRIRTVVDDAISRFREELHITEGKKVLELRPAVSCAKKSSVKWILNQSGLDPAAAIYVGDDRTDEDAFAALPASVTINVGTEFGSTSARYFVRSTDGVLAFIQTLPLANTHPARADARPVALRALIGR